MSFYRQTEALFLVFEINLPVCSQSKLKVCKEVLLLWLEKEKGERVGSVPTPSRSMSLSVLTIPS